MRTVHTIGGKRVPRVARKKLPSPGTDHVREYLRKKGETPPDRITAELLDQWFDAHFIKPKPSRDALKQIAAEITHLTERPGGPGAGDIFREMEAKRFMALWHSAQALRAAWEDYCTNMIRVLPPDTISDTFWQVDALLEALGIVAANESSQPKKRGRPKEEWGWHISARKFADLIEKALKDAGYKKRLSRKQEESTTVFIVMKLVQHFFPTISISESGVAKAMQFRSRTKATKLSKSFEELFPGAARIQVLRRIKSL